MHCPLTAILKTKHALNRQNDMNSVLKYETVKTLGCRKADLFLDHIDIIKVTEIKKEIDMLKENILLYKTILMI